MTACLVAKFEKEFGVGFGTSGVRALVSALTDKVVFGYTLGFLGHIGPSLRPGQDVAIGGDLRSSTPRLMLAAGEAIRRAGYQPISLGLAPSPAVALFGIRRSIPTVMVTGSHIPDDRNGVKFTTSKGEISKDDEAGIKRQMVDIPAELFDGNGMFVTTPAALDVVAGAVEEYERRYLDVFPAELLRGMRIGVYQHSTVSRDILVSLLRALGAEVKAFGRSEVFIPVDTEAVRSEDASLFREFAKLNAVDAIVSADGDGDRPLIGDEQGKILRGDVAGILTARFLGADAVAAPVSCNTALELCGAFSQVERTRIGSPYVIAGMQELEKRKASHVVSYEANGGFLLGSEFSLFGKRLGALPTRDSVIVLLAILASSAKEKAPLSEIIRSLPARFSASDRVKEFPSARSAAIVARFLENAEKPDAVARTLGEMPEVNCAIDHVNGVDGCRIFYRNGDILHFRASGNAPEFRCYTEASSEARALELLAAGMRKIQEWKGQ